MTDLSARLERTHNARTVIPGVLYRSDALAELTDAGRQALADLRIGTVIDLRTDAERARAADALPADGSVQLIELPILGGAMDEMARSMMPAAGGPGLGQADLLAGLERVPTLEQLYLGMLVDGQEQFAAVARAVVAAAGTDRPGVLVHCTAGKDRTGVACALLLEVAGADHGRIVADYTETERNLAGGFAERLTALITSMGIPLTPKLRALATEAPAEAIEAVLTSVAAQYGDAAGYLRAAGLDTDELDALSAALRTG